MATAAEDQLSDLRRQWESLKGGKESASTPEPLPSPPLQSREPPKLSPKALYGLAGDIVRAIDPTTEGAPAGVLVTELVMFGNAVNRGPHIMVGDDRHGTNENSLLVGETAKARKGTTQAPVQRLMSLVDSEWAGNRVMGGLVSGEGLVWAIRDPIMQFNRKTGEEEQIDPGVADKRILAVEEEFASVLKAAARPGNTLSETMRRAWDSRAWLRSLTKNSPAKASNPHASIIAHITGEELKDVTASVDIANGLLNRFLFVHVQRSKLLPEPKRMADDEAQELAKQLQDAWRFALTAGELRRNGQARDAWYAVYPELSRDRAGVVGMLAARAEAHVTRLSLIYALLDCSKDIRLEHLEAALAVWEYVEQSLLYIFGDATGNPLADRALAALRATGAMTRKDLFDLFGRNVSAAQLDRALELLVTLGKILVSQAEPDGPGRPATTYIAKGAAE
jgi:hypothetical protein